MAVNASFSYRFAYGNHTVGVIANGGCVAEKKYTLTNSRIYGYGRPAYDADAPQQTRFSLSMALLRRGSKGESVRALQMLLLGNGFSCGKWGADGDFGDATEIALKYFQRDYNLEVDGIYGKNSHTALMAAIDAAAEKPKDAVNQKNVVIEGGNCYVRKAPNTTADILGVAYKGESYQYQGDTAANGWHLIIYKNQNGWVSGKYGKLEA